MSLPVLNCKNRVVTDLVENGSDYCGKEYRHHNLQRKAHTQNVDTSWQTHVERLIKGFSILCQKKNLPLHHAVSQNTVAG